MNQVEIKAKMMALQDAIASALKNKTFEKERNYGLKGMKFAINYVE